MTDQLENPPSRRLACSGCGTEFTCGLAGACWCAEEVALAPIMSPRRLGVRLETHDAHASRRGSQRRPDQSRSGLNSAGPDRILRPPQLCKLRCAQRRLALGEELVELRRGDFGRAQHRVRLTPMMNLMLKQVKQQPI